MRRLQRILADVLAVLAIALMVPSAIDQAARAQGGGVAEIAAYEGADRERRLIEGAKKEKELTFYSSIPTDDISALVAAFDKRYGGKVRVWRADSEGFLQRIMREAKARRFEVDIMAGSTSALEPLHRENLLQEVKSPNFADQPHNVSQVPVSRDRSVKVPSWLLCHNMLHSFMYSSVMLVT